MPTLSDSRTLSGRRYYVRAVRGRFFSLALVYRDRKKREVYAVDEATEPGDAVRVFVVEKVAKTRSPFGPYEVLIGPVLACCSCSCVGSGRWQTCKHVDALFDHVTRGAIPEAPR